MGKRTKLPLIALTAGLISLQASAQTNTFPSTGNAGIGTTSPAFDLDIRSTSSGSAASNIINSNTVGNSFMQVGEATTSGKYLFMQYLNSGYTPSGIFTPNSSIIGTGATGGFKIYSTSSDLTMYTGGYAASNERFRIASNGAIGFSSPNPNDLSSITRFQFEYAGRNHINIVGNVAAGNTSSSIAFTDRTSGSVSVNRIAQISAWNSTTGNSTGSKFQIGTFQTSNGTYNLGFTMDAVGFVGLGTENPTARLHAVLDGNGANFQRYAGIPAIYLRKANGTEASPTIVGANEQLGGIAGSGYDGANHRMAACIYFSTDNSTGIDDMPGRITFNTTLDGSITNSERMRITNAGNVGINTTAPIAKFHVALDGNGSVFERYAGSPVIYIGRKNGTVASPTIVSNGDNVAQIAATGYDGSVYQLCGKIQFDVDGATGAGDMPGRIVFKTVPDGSYVDAERMRITNAGKVGIGTTAPSTKFHVSENLTGVYAMTLENTHTTGSGLLIKAGGAGSNINLLTITDNAGGEILKVRGADKTMYVRELEVRIGAFPDYVFEKNYPLMPLSELEAYINKNKHLPNVPSAKEVEENGANVGNLVKVQMEKIEELTLYLIELKKENEEIKKQLEEIKNK